ncbi:hypothetical protein Emed_003987 [Eimeria media]
MAAPWRPEGGSHFPIGRINEAQQAKPTGSQTTEGITIRQHDLLLRHRLHHAQRALGGASVLALVLAALALTYLMVTCMRHLSRGFKFSNQQSRLLASNYPDEDEGSCQAPLGDEEEETEAEDAEGLEPEGAAAAALPEEVGAYGPAPAVPAGQTRRILPGSIQTRVGRTIMLLEQPVTALTSLIPLLRPDHCLGTVRVLCRIAVLELSAFATVPQVLQPLRQRVAQTYVNLIEQVLTTEPTAAEAFHQDWTSTLRAMQLLLQRIAQTPPETERLPGNRYRLMMENQRRVCHWMITQVLHVLQTIKDVKTQDPTPRSNETVFHRRRALHSLFLTRRIQVLRYITLRYWLEQHHRDLGVYLIYGPEAFKEALNSPLDKLVDRLNALTHAATEGGGTAANRFTYLPPMTPEQLQMLQHQPLLQPLGHQQQPGPSHPHPPQAHGPAPMGPFAPPPAPQAHPLMQPIPHAPYMPQLPPPAQGAAQAPPPALLDLAAQDSQFPVINPEPQIAGQQQAPIAVPPIHLPPIYNYLHPSALLFDESPTSSSASATFGGASSAPSQPSGTPGQPQPPQGSSQQTHTGTNQDSSSDDDE